MKVFIKSKLSPHKFKTPEGYLICQNSIIARTGVQEYLKSELYPELTNTSEGNEIVKLYRDEDEVFSEPTMASFENKPLTCEHPSENVTPSNFKAYAEGFVRDIHRGEEDGLPVMLANIIVTDRSTIEDIENGIRTDLSCGYDCDIEDVDGKLKVTNIRGNHVALCEEGRAGNARIIDSAKSLNDAKENSKYIIRVKSTGGTYHFIDEVNNIDEDLGTSDSISARDIMADKHGLRPYDYVTHTELRDGRPNVLASALKLIDEYGYDVMKPKLIELQSAVLNDFNPPHYGDNYENLDDDMKSLYAMVYPNENSRNGSQYMLFSGKSPNKFIDTIETRLGSDISSKNQVIEDNINAEDVKSYLNRGIFNFRSEDADSLNSYLKDIYNQIAKLVNKRNTIHVDKIYMNNVVNERLRDNPNLSSVQFTVIFKTNYKHPRSGDRIYGTSQRDNILTPEERVALNSVILSMLENGCRSWSKEYFGFDIFSSDKNIHNTILGGDNERKTNSVSDITDTIGKVNYSLTVKSEPEIRQLLNAAKEYNSTNVNDSITFKIVSDDEIDDEEPTKSKDEMFSDLIEALYDKELNKLYSKYNGKK